MLVTESKYRQIARYIIFMKMAESLAKLSCDPKRQVAALLVKKDFTNVISIGINGTVPGEPNVRSSMDSGNSGLRHAERNCLLHANVTNPEQYMLFCTLSPCDDCAGDIVVKKIDTVYYKDIYPTAFEAGQRVMKNAGIHTQSIWDKISEMFSELFEADQYDGYDMNQEDVFRLRKKHLEKFGMPFVPGIDTTGWENDFPGHFTKYLYSIS